MTRGAAINACLLSLFLFCAGCTQIEFTPSVFPNPVLVEMDELPEALRLELNALYPDDTSLKIQYSAESSIYGVTDPSGSIFLFDATGRQLGMII